MSQWLQQQWYKIGLAHLILVPLSWLFALLVWLRSKAYQLGIFASHRLPVPVVVVGNVSVGGTGKTPLVIALVEALIQAGYRPGVVSRGYGGKHRLASLVTSNSLASEFGDEPVLIARRTGQPVWIGRNRVDAAKALLQAYPECNVIVSDDGLQHYAMQRDVEIAVVDGERLIGNGYQLPAGALREPLSRLTEVDAIVVNGHHMPQKILANSHAKAYLMTLQATQFNHLQSSQSTCDAAAFAGLKIHAIAGIGYPQRFFDTLTALGLTFEAHVFPDHYQFTAQDLHIPNAGIILMTEKDAVKCTAFATAQCWYLPVTAMLQNDFIADVINKIETINHQDIQYKG